MDRSDQKDYDLTCWYLNLRRVVEIAGTYGLKATISRYSSISEIGNEGLKRVAVLAAAKDAIVEWARSAQPPTLGQLLLSDTVAPGKIFTHYSNFFCVGLGKHRKAFDDKKPITLLPEIYSKLDELSPNVRLTMRYHPAHLTSESAWATLSGQKQLFVLGVIDRIHDHVIEAIPYVFASLLTHLGEGSFKGYRWGSRLEVFVDNIDSFSLVRNKAVPTKGDLELLRHVPEQQIKEAFAEIIEEPVIPKDWGGESSDLFSSYVKLDGQRISAAFAFKGKAKFKPMTMADLGKNGDQIHRLYSEPADLLVLQHAHEITPPVRGAMRAYATTIGNPRLFSLISGYDTIRILRAYGKCGF